MEQNFFQFKQCKLDNQKYRKHQVYIKKYLLGDNQINLEFCLFLMFQTIRSLSETLPVNTIKVLLIQLNFNANFFCLKNVFDFDLKSFLQNWLLSEIMMNRKWHCCTESKRKILLFQRCNI
jgi:hypothetical protein